MFVCNRYDIVFNIITFSDNTDTLPRIPKICLCTIYKRHWLGVMHGLSQKKYNERARRLYVIQWRPLTENAVKYLREKAIDKELLWFNTFSLTCLISESK